MSNKSILNKNKFLIFLNEFVRIKDATYWALITLLGFFLGITSFSISQYIIPFLIVVISAFCITSFTFAINNYFDVESDIKNPRRIKINAIASKNISKKIAIIFLFIFILVPLIACLLFGGIVLFLFCALLIIMGWAYSSPPLRLKSIPIVDLVLHFFGFFLLVIFGSYIAGNITRLSWLVAISAGIFSCIFQILNHILDYSYDKKSGTITSAVWMGLDKAKKLFYIIIFIHLIVILIITVNYSFTYLGTLIILILAIIFGIFKTIQRKLTSLKLSIVPFVFFFSIFLYINCILYQFFFILKWTPLIEPFNILFL